MTNIKYLLDTNTVSYFIRQVSRASSARYTRTPMDELAISSVTAGEMLHGIVKKPEAVRLAKLVKSVLSEMTVLPWTKQTAVRYAQLRFSSEQVGLTISLPDLMIAAHASEHNLVLVFSYKLFRKIKPAIAVQNWCD